MALLPIGACRAIDSQAWVATGLSDSQALKEAVSGGYGLPYARLCVKLTLKPAVVKAGTYLSQSL